MDLEEWEEFQPAHVLPPDTSGKLWNKIDKNSPSTAAHHSYFKWMAVAASVLSVVGLSWYFLSKRQNTSTIGAAAIAMTRNIYNNTTRKMMLALSDGSTVELSPTSTLSYSENFSSSKREVRLNGEANFDIAKDVSRPFYVYSNAVSITVLGTRFTVSSYESNNAAKVILHDGRVMIKLSHSSSRENKNEYYLFPGDVFIFKKVNRRSHTINPAPVATAKGISSDPPTDSLSPRILHLEKDKEDRYLFDNYPLDVVFDQLQIIYDTKIIYNKSELGNRSFIGKIDKKDSLLHILQSIALLNNFSLHKQGDSYIIGN